MYYITEYEMCALLFLILVTIRFVGMRKFKNRSNRLFGIIMVCAIANISLDIFGAYLIERINTVPIWLNYGVNTLFYMMQVAIPALLLIYVIVLAGSDVPKPIYLVLLPILVDEVLIISNPFTGVVFSVKETADGLIFTHGSLFNLLYGVSLFYLICTVASVIILRRYYRKSEIRTILSFVALSVVAVAFQVLFPRLLLTGVAMSVSIFMMFLTMQNPETMLDTITGAFNYSALSEYLRRQIVENRPIWITAVDVGGIRRINSMMGIRFGNELLEQVGRYISTLDATHATSFRMIGTRFIVISDNEDTHKKIVLGITERFKKTWLCGGTSTMLLATVRYCENNSVFSSPEDVVNLVDLAYAKTATEGFGTTRKIDEDQLKQFRRQGKIRDALRHALASGTGFSLNYQPIFSIEEQCFCGAEALLRFHDEQFGYVFPGEFIPIAETTGLINQIDTLVVKMASEFLKSHRELFDKGFRLLQINLSAVEFNDGTENVLNDIINEIDTIEDKICFEVTETAVTARREVLSDFMNKLIARGVKFAIDDFGTGYANITQVAKLPFSVVKLDRVFVTQNSEKEVKLLSDLVKMFNHIGLSTIFEGVETAEQAIFATGIGVNEIQGFYYSRPLTSDDFVGLLIGKAETVVC